MRSLILSFFLTLVSSSTEQATSSDYVFNALIPFVNNITLFDGPSSIANAPCTASNKLLTPTQLQYYDYFAASMYCSNGIQNLTCQYCQYFNSNVSSNKVIRNETTDAVAMVTVTQDKKEIVVTFRGSYAIINFLLDATAIQIDVSKNIKIHSGFFISTMSVYYPVVREVQAQLALNPGFKVVITGHSLGGSMASLTQFFFVYLNQFPGVSFTLVTFGQPRTGNKGYADYMKSLTIPMVRVTNRADIIPHAVPVSIAGTTVLGDYYYHHQTEHWVNGTGRYCSQTIYEDPSCSDSLGPLYSIFDHLVYLDCNYASCYLGNPTPLASVPIVFDPQTLGTPVLPTYLTPKTEDLTGTGYGLIYPLLG